MAQKTKTTSDAKASGAGKAKCDVYLLTVQNGTPPLPRYTANFNFKFSVWSGGKRYDLAPFDENDRTDLMRQVLNTISLVAVWPSKSFWVTYNSDDQITGISKDEP